MSQQPDRPSWASTALTLSLVGGFVVGLATVLLAIGRGIGCSMEDDCGSSTWLLVLALLAVMAIVAPFVGFGALTGRSGSEARWIVLSMVGPTLMWVVAFVVIAA
ncbi:MAG: hypothetical protein RIB65_20510 [Ilumatobacter fluminis]|uniref:hypothetical protein n=1 Tax=Ilumatobacter fluminis TaxID=467091 RepID=UPI0032F01B44